MGTALFLLLLTCGAGVFLLLQGRMRRKSEAGVPGREKTGGLRGRVKPTLILFSGLTIFSLSPLLQSGVGMRFLSVFLYFLLFFITLGYAGGCFFEKTGTGGRSRRSSLLRSCEIDSASPLRKVQNALSRRSSGAERRGKAVTPGALPKRSPPGRTAPPKANGNLRAEELSF